MKKAISALCLGLLLVGCSGGDADSKEINNSGPSSEEPQKNEESKDKIVDTGKEEEQDNVEDSSKEESQDKVVDTGGDKTQDNTGNGNDQVNNKDIYCPMVECYIVQKGDTLRSIANKFGVTIEELDVWNSLHGSDSLYVGQMLEIAGGSIDPEKGEDNPEYNLDDVVKNVKEYLLSGMLYQVYWDERFLNRIDIEALFSGYLAAGGYPLSPGLFGEYINENAPVIGGWEDLIKASVLENYGYEVIRFEHAYDVYYVGYVEIDGEEVPYVTVNARTGDYHG